MKQSIVTWIPWPADGVEGLPEGKPMIVMTDNGNTGNRCLWKMHGRLLVVATGEPIWGEALEHLTHYALASDLERDIEPTLPRNDPGLQRAKIIQDEGDEDRVRWLALMRAIWFAFKNRGALTFEEWAQDFEYLARTQVERERKEGGHE